MRILIASFALSSYLFSYNIDIDLKGKGGNIYIGLFKDQKNFPKSEFVFKGKVVKDSTSKVKFEDIPSGLYAISLYHDENNNTILDKNFIGIPNEGYGFSTNPFVFGTPDFDDAKFELNSDKELTIEVKH